ncbi:hypothetical protein NEK97_12675 [Paenarthrobacter sp. UW852]|uniref:hypothetical protein n=1 Tax=Paenarthrobacter sp. UW852 TaxID=2951989 RepID=UPI0021476F47|nr:hypothetical protein [Paenarthrobacter sp. UW852]MCR1162317.1 hypothetical protein [Paenarthrobacter sp. UW852]
MHKYLAGDGIGACGTLQWTPNWAAGWMGYVMGSLGLSATEIGAEVGATPEEINRLLLDQGFYYGRPGAYGLTSKGKTFGVQRHHDNGYGGVAYRSWETTRFDPTILEALDVSAEKLTKVRTDIADDRRTRRDARNAARVEADANYRAGHAEDAEDEARPEIDWGKILLGAALFGGVIAASISVKKGIDLYKRNKAEQAATASRDMKTVCGGCRAGMANGVMTCPHCGATSAAGDLELTGSGTLEAVVVEVGYSEAEPWLSKWDDVIRDYEAVEEAFLAEGTDNRVIRHRLLRFFEDCWHLVEWIKRDTQLPAEVAEKVVKAAWNADPMVLCEAIASTSKHHTREGRKGQPEKVTARVMSVTMPQGIGKWSPTVTVTAWNPEAPEPQDHDARTLASDCISWWRSFIKQNRLPVPWEENADPA